MVKHIHHIVPRYMGGTDDPSNLVELTVEEHAEAHRKLYEEHGNIEDFYAWKGLTGQIGKEEKIRIRSLLGNKKANENGAYLKGNARHVHLMKTDPEYNARVRKAQSKPNRCAENKKGPKSKEHAENIRKAALSRPRVPCKFCGNGFTKANIKKHEKFCG